MAHGTQNWGLVHSASPATLCSCSHSAYTAMHVSLIMQINTPSLLEWYNEWKGQPAESAVSKLPVVKVEELLKQLGAPPDKMLHIQATLSPDDLPALRSLVLPSFVANMDAGFVSQLVSFDFTRGHVQAGQSTASFGSQPRYERKFLVLSCMQVVRNS